MDKTRVYLTESLSTKEKKGKDYNVFLATTIMIMGYIIMAAGIALACYFFFTDYQIANYLIIVEFLASIVAGILTIGFGKVIKLLQEINYNLKK